ncbi:hypothetical protein FOMG_17911 [Fusarium oxysporum f. sp. melonis 26406]|uniref:Uncharacterized protein n=1 Tax=Fusarium oxysporum f. sp. melonis 26406 TaxID=1089452 RepID=W9ZWH7_FUSOX|nr:hypothetical protein FOMG_17911 [Fusarium oxysporum f. sp. melonis 26406]
MSWADQMESPADPLNLGLEATGDTGTSAKRATQKEMSQLWERLVGKSKELDDTYPSVAKLKDEGEPKSEGIIMGEGDAIAQVMETVKRSIRKEEKNEESDADKQADEIEGEASENKEIVKAKRRRKWKERREKIPVKAKEVTQGLMKIGAVAANTASVVIAPAQIAGNVLSHVVNAWETYEDMFVELCTLLTQCADFMGRYDLLKDINVANIAPVCCKLLKLFIDLCDETIALHGRGKQAVAFGKVLLDKGTNISDLTKRMRELNESEGRNVGAATLKIAHTTLKLASEEKQVIDRRKQIARALGFVGTALNRDGEPDEPWLSTFNKRKRMLEEGMGEWMARSEEYQWWSTGAADTPPVIILEGAAGSGRTSLMASLVTRASHRNRLQPQPQGTMAAAQTLNETSALHSRVVTAHFFAEADKRKSNVTQEEDFQAADAFDKSFLDSVMQAIIWQLSMNYEAMTRAVYAQIQEHCSSEDNSLEGPDLCKKILFPAVKKQDTTFLVFVDAPDVAVRHLWKLVELFTLNRCEKIRLLMTTNLNAFGGLNKNACECTVIGISKKNHEDISRYIEVLLKRMILSTTSSYEETNAATKFLINSLINTARDKLPSVLKHNWHDYHHLRRALATLSKVRHPGEITSILEELQIDQDRQVEESIEKLNNELTPGDIQEVNEIITWVEGAYEWMTVQEMEIILAMDYSRCDESTTHGQWSNPLLRYRLEKYCDIFSISHENDYISWSSEKMGAHFPQRSEPSTPPKTILKEEVDIVKHALKSICPEPLYKRFQFEAFFQNHLDQPDLDFTMVSGSVVQAKPKIWLDRHSTNIRIALKCLKILTNKDLHQFTSLRRYAARYVLRHLSDVPDIEPIKQSFKTQIGPLLIKLLTDSCAFDALFWPSDLKSNRQLWEKNEGKEILNARVSWVYSNQGVKQIARWLTDKAVASSILDKPGKRLLDAMEAPDANLYKALLSDWAKHMACHLFCHINLSNRVRIAAITFLKSYLIQVGEIETQMEMPATLDKCEGTVLNFLEKDLIPPEYLVAIEKWAEQILERERFDDVGRSMWEANFVNAADDVCEDFDKWTENDTGMESTSKRAHTAWQLNPENLHACLIRVQKADEVDPKVIDKLEQVVDEMSKREGDTDKTDELFLGDSWSKEVFLGHVIHELGDIKWKAGDREGASFHRKSLEHGYGQMRSWANVLKAYRDQEAWGEVIDFVDALNSSSGIWLPHLEDFDPDFAGSENVRVLEILAEAANAVSSDYELPEPPRKTPPWDVIKEFFALAAKATEKKDLSHLRVLVFEHGASTFANAAGNALREDVLKNREEAWKELKRNEDILAPATVVSSIRDYLAEVYLDRGKSSSLSAEETKRYGDALVDLVSDPEQAWSNIVAVCCLIRFYNFRSLDLPDTAKICIRAIIRDGVELLSDYDETNDDSAFRTLARLLTTLGDEKNAVVCWRMRSVLWYNSISGGAAPVGPEDSQLEVRDVVVDHNTNPNVSLPQDKLEESGNETDHETGVNTKQENGEDGYEMKTDKESTQGNSDDSDDSDSDDPTEVEKPASLVVCSGCDKDLTLARDTLYTCIDCGGRRQFDDHCWKLLKSGELNLEDKGLACRREHDFMVLPMWDEDIAKRWTPEFVPGMDGENILLDNWKRELKQTYGCLSDEAPICQ